jgi:hypothetical protein
MSIESICWWSYPIGCNRWDSSGSWSSLIFIGTHKHIESLMVSTIKRIIKG